MLLTQGSARHGVGCAIFPRMGTNTVPVINNGVCDLTSGVTQTLVSCSNLAADGHLICPDNRLIRLLVHSSNHSPMCRILNQKQAPREMIEMSVEG